MPGRRWTEEQRAEKAEQMRAHWRTPSALVARELRRIVNIEESRKEQKADATIQVAEGD